MAIPRVRESGLDELLHRVRETIKENMLVKSGATLVVGVSGGPDSLALLHVLKTLAPELGINLYIAHLNHQLRGVFSDADETFVLAVGREWSIPVASASWDVQGYAAEQGLSIEEAARNLRYRFLAGVAKGVHSNVIAVAHNADDQVETVLLHFLRGAGLAGLRGMAYKSRLMTDDEQETNDAHVSPSDIDLIRPFLDVSRAEIEAYCEEHGLQPRMDATNSDTTILRNRLRHEVIPYLETVNPNFREVVRHSALAIRDDYSYIQQNILGIFDRMTRRDRDAYIFDRKWFRALPVNLQRGVLREAVSRLRKLKNIGFQHIENARRVAADKDAGAEATLPQGLLLVVGYDDFTVGEHLPLPNVPLLLNNETISLQVGREQLLDGTDWIVRTTELSAAAEPHKWSVLLDADKVQGHLVLRTRKAGERFCPRGMDHKSKSLHEFMIDEKIPRHLREFIPILADDEKTLWIANYRQDERSVVTHDTRQALIVEFVPVSD